MICRTIPPDPCGESVEMGQGLESLGSTYRMVNVEGKAPSTEVRHGGEMAFYW